MAPWTAEPLASIQMEYAALIAVVPLELYQWLVKKIGVQTQYRQYTMTMTGNASKRQRQGQQPQQARVLPARWYDGHEEDESTRHVDSDEDEDFCFA